MHPQKEPARAKRTQTQSEKWLTDTLVAQAERAGLLEVLEVHVVSHYGVEIHELTGNQLSLVEQTFSYLYAKIDTLPNRVSEH